MSAAPVFQTMGPCVCGCGVVGTKLVLPLEFDSPGHVKGCNCRPHIGKRSQRKGQRAQSRVLKAAARAEGTTMERAPTHEEQARLLVHYESKAGTSLPKGMTGDMMRHFEQQARVFAERQIPIRKWALVFTFPGGAQRIWMDFAQYLQLVSEIQELP